jgi:hypothetical protein
MRSLHLAIPYVLVLLVYGCQGNSGDQAEDSTSATTTSAEPLPPLPQEIRDTLFAYADYVDMIFYESPISASQSERNTVRSVVYFPSMEPATPNPNCKPTGRLSFMIQGRIACEADFYFTDNCKYFLFIEHEEVVYGNKMSANAVNFFQNIISQAQTVK